PALGGAGGAFRLTSMLPNNVFGTFHFRGSTGCRLARGSPPMNKIIDLVSLASIVPPPNHEVSGGFTAMVNGEQVRVRAVLERTVVIEHHEGGERSVVRKDNCMVKP